MKLNKLLFSLLIILVIFTSCKSETEKKLEYADDLLEAVEEFEEDRVSVIKTIKKSSNIITKIEDKKISIRGAAKEWEKNWKVAKEEIKELKANFKKIGRKSIEYFNMLEENTSKINDRELRH